MYYLYIYEYQHKISNLHNRVSTSKESKLILTVILYKLNHLFFNIILYICACVCVCVCVCVYVCVNVHI